MRVTFCGVGEAFDETLPNVSLLAETGTTSLLMDCGFTAAAAFWSAAEDPLALDAVSVSHFHGDHFFGLPHLLLRFFDEKRTKPLTVFGGADLAERVSSLTDQAYRNLLATAPFDIRFEECAPGDERRLGDLRLRFAANDHPQPCLAVRADGPDGSVFYSGDGRPTLETRRLAAGCDLVVHESFTLDAARPGHGSVSGSIGFAREVGAGALALVHIQRGVRRGGMDAILDMAARADDLNVWGPLPGERVQVPCARCTKKE